MFSLLDSIGAVSLFILFLVLLGVAIGLLAVVVTVGREAWAVIFKKAPKDREREGYIKALAAIAVGHGDPKRVAEHRFRVSKEEFENDDFTRGWQRACMEVMEEYRQHINMDTPVLSERDWETDRP